MPKLCPLVAHHLDLLFTLKNKIITHKKVFTKTSH